MVAFHWFLTCTQIALKADRICTITGIPCIRLLITDTQTKTLRLVMTPIALCSDRDTHEGMDGWADIICLAFSKECLRHDWSIYIYFIVYYVCFVQWPSCIICCCHVGSGYNSDSNPYSGAELRPWTFQWDLTLYLLTWTMLHIYSSFHQWQSINTALQSRTGNDRWLV